MVIVNVRSRRKGGRDRLIRALFIVHLVTKALTMRLSKRPIRSQEKKWRGKRERGRGEPIRES